MRRNRPVTRQSRIACALLGSLVLLLAFAVQASATRYIHPFISQFGPDGTESTKFNQNAFIAVDQSTHDVYVVDSFADKIYRFTDAGAAHNFSEGPGAGTNAIPVSVPGNLAGVPIKGIAIAPAGAAGGTAGDVYVAWSAASNVAPGPYSWGVEVYSPAGAHLGTLDGSGNPHHFPTESVDSAHPCGIAVDPAGSVYVSNCATGSEPSHVDKYMPSSDPVANGDFDSEIVGLDNPADSTYSLAATGTTLYTMGFREGATYPLSLFPGGGGSAEVSGEGTQLPATSERAFTVDASSGDLYVGGAVGARQGLRQFDESGEELSFIDVPNRANGVGFDEFTGRVYVSNFGGPGSPTNKVRIYGAGVAVAPPVVSIDPVSGISSQSAHFSGTVNAGGTGEGQPTTYRFQCTPSCPGLQEVRSIPADGLDHAVSDDAMGLSPETSYEVRLIASNAEGLQTVEATTDFETLARPPATAPEVTIDSVTQFTAETAHLTGTVDPNGSGEPQATTYRFEYSSDGLKWVALSKQGPIEGGSPQQVSADLEGLQPNTTYIVRLSAENFGGEATNDPPNPSFTTDLSRPEVETSPATHVLAGSAQLNGRVNPRNAETTYYFLWGTTDCSANPCAAIPATEDAAAGSGADFVSVHAQLKGLSPTTTYHYRLVAKSSAGQATGGDATFATEADPAPCANGRVGLSLALPGCRAYEMVSPPDKNGGDVGGAAFRTRAAADGNAVSFMSLAAFAGSEGLPYSGAEYASRRGADGWSTHSITPLVKAPYVTSTVMGSQYVGHLSGDLEAGVYVKRAPNPGAPANVERVSNLYLARGIRAGTPAFHLLSDSVNPLPKEEAGLLSRPLAQLVGHSADLGKVVFETTSNLTAQAHGDGNKLYEWSGGELRLAGILPDSACGSPPCVAAESAGGMGAVPRPLGGEGLFDVANPEAAHAVSKDGSRVFFTAGDPLKISNGGDEGFEGALYLRDGGHTVQIDASERSAPDPGGPGRSEFQWATADGGEALFFSAEALVDGDPVGGGRSLYRYRVESPVGERLSLVPTPGELEHIAAASDDGSFAYFLAGGVLYVLHDGKLRRIAPDPGGEAFGAELGTRLPAGYRNNQPRLADGGRVILFPSRRNLTGFDPRIDEPENLRCVPDARCAELYLYDYDEDELTCVSCPEAGTPPTNETEFYFPFADLGAAGVGVSTYLNTPISADGRYVFFSSPEELVRQDTNGRYDAYVYDVARREARLLSTGQCNCDSIFMTASPSGRDAFFTTRQRLVRADTDNLADLYDARVGGGIASQNAPPPAECQGDACQAPPSPPSNPTAASAAFAGPGNIAQRPSCAAIRRRARRLTEGARRLRRAARTAAPDRAKRLRRRAGQTAKRGNARTRACRRRNRRAGR
jgi:hypothetical protein